MARLQLCGETQGNTRKEKATAKGCKIPCTFSIRNHVEMRVDLSYICTTEKLYCVAGYARVQSCD